MTEAESRGIFLLRDAFLAQHPAVRVRLLRAFFKRGGLILDETGTRRVLEFTKAGASGRGLDLPGGFRFRREFHRYCLEEERNPGQDLSLDLPDPGPGEGTVLLGGRAFSVRWGERGGRDARFGVDLPLSGLDFPLRVRGWLPGDRISLTYGTKKLKKLLAEAGVPLGERNSTPVLTDADGAILWVAGVATAASMKFTGHQARFSIGIDETDDP
jgi:tRNA(Ile)-lysidine synthetase-like protein